MPVYLVINYTDYHDVDEDEKTIPFYNARWDEQSRSGITVRFMNHTPTVAGAIVASICRHPKIILIIRIGMMSTKIYGLSRFKVTNGHIISR